MATQTTLYYFVKLDEGVIGHVDVDTTETIGDICDKFYDAQKDIFERHRLSPGQLESHAPLNLSREPVSGLPQRVDATPFDCPLVIWDRVREIFTNELDPELVHIVIMPQTRQLRLEDFL